MLWRHHSLVLALTAAGLLTCLPMVASAAGEPDERISEIEAQAVTVKVLEAEKAGTLTVEVRGQGPDKVRMSLKNTSSKRLNVILPPGLVASSAVGQGGGGFGNGGGLQSMGLGIEPNQTGGFGRFAGNNIQPGFRSIAPSDPSIKPAVTVPAGQKVDIDIPAVCLNFGLTTPTLRDKFQLVDVDDYSKDVRVRKALRALATLGTSHGTAQAAMWRVCNDVPFEMMLTQSDKLVNPYEVALASRFIEALDQSADAVEMASMTEGRLFVTIESDGSLAKDARRLAVAIDKLRILGLPAQMISSGEAPKSTAPAFHLGISLTSGPSGETRGKVVVQTCNGAGGANGWSTLDEVSFKDAQAISAIEGNTLASLIDHAASSALVTTKVSMRTVNNATLKIENRMPFTLSCVSVKAGSSADGPIVILSGLGVGPGRSGLIKIPAANGSVDHVELNGL